MSVSASTAVSAYAKQVKNQLNEAMQPRSGDPGQSFAEMVGDSLNSAVETGRQSEVMSAKAVAGKAELNQVITAVTNAEVTLQTVLAVRDKVIAAYQEIVRMPI